MGAAKPYRITSITELHRLAGYGKPLHPLITILDLDGVSNNTGINSAIFDFYAVSMKRGCDKLFYGQQKYDFDEGVMAFWAPGQILRGEANGLSQNLSGWMLFVHPDFLWNTPLAKKISQYEYFDYNTNEALFLSDKEESVINSIIDNIRSEYSDTIDKFSQDVIVAQLEVLFTYAQRYYERQFITRKIANNKILNRVEDVLNAYFKDATSAFKGLPTVQYVADELNISVKYLSSVLKQLTGQTTQQHIHDKLIEQAKEKLSTSDLSVSEIAYDLGFEHPQSFSKLFKAKTNQSPMAFRQAFN